MMFATPKFLKKPIGRFHHFRFSPLLQARGPRFGRRAETKEGRPREKVSNGLATEQPRQHECYCPLPT